MTNYFKHMKIGIIFCILSIGWLPCSQSAAQEPFEVDGLIEPHAVINLGTPSQGVVSKVVVDRGSEITEGQILVELDSSVERAGLRKAQVVESFDGAVKLQEAQLAYAQQIYRRLIELEGIPDQEKEKAATEIIQSKHRLEKAKEEKKLAAYEVKKAGAILDQRVIKSPVDGIVMERFVSPGEYVSNQPLLRIAQIDPLRIETIVPAEYFDKLGIGTPVTITPELAGYPALEAKVTLVDKFIDSPSNTFRVRIEIANKDHSIPSGMRAKVQFQLNDTPPDDH